MTIHQRVALGATMTCPTLNTNYTCTICLHRSQRAHMVKLDKLPYASAQALSEESMPSADAWATIEQATLTSASVTPFKLMTYLWNYIKRQYFLQLCFALNTCALDLQNFQGRFTQPSTQNNWGTTHNILVHNRLARCKWPIVHPHSDSYSPAQCAWGMNSAAQQTEVWWLQLKKSGPASQSPQIPTPVGSAWQGQAQVQQMEPDFSANATTKAYRMTGGLATFKLNQNAQKRVHINYTFKM